MEGGHHKHVGHAAHEEAVEGFVMVFPVVVEGETVSADDLEVGASGVGGADFEASRVDDAVEFVFFAIGYDALLCDCVDAEAVCVD